MAIFSAVRNDFSNYGRGSPKKHFYAIILKSVHWSRRRCHLKFFLALEAILFNFAISIDGHSRNIFVKLF